MGALILWLSSSAQMVIAFMGPNYATIQRMFLTRSVFDSLSSLEAWKMVNTWKLSREFNMIDKALWQSLQSALTLPLNAALSNIHNSGTISYL